jgi:general secretion pathway protein F
VTVLVALRLVYGTRRAADPMALTMHGLAWLAIFCSLFGGLVMLFGPFGLILWLACGGLAILMLGQQRAVYQRTLLRLLALGVEKQMPLPQLVAAYAAESPGWMSRKVQRFADSLFAGMPLPEAIITSRGLVPRYTRLATQVGLAAGNLGHALREAAMTLALRRPLWHAAAGRIYYLAWFFVTLPAVLTFMMIKIEPAMQAIMADFDTQFGGDGSVLGEGRGVIIFIMMTAWIASLILVPYFTLHYLGLIRFGLPGLNRLLRPFETSVVLRCLALGTERGVPLSDILPVLADYYPSSSMRYRLADVAHDVKQGHGWTESLHRRGVASPQTGAVIDAAQRLGNVTWALREIADQTERRLAARLEAWSRILFVIVILLCGLIVAYIVTMFFLPLVTLILKGAQ